MNDDLVKKNIIRNIDNYKKDQESLINSQNDDSQVLVTSVNNNECLKSRSNQCIYEKEKTYLGSWPPKWGLALSGGGTRAASFSIGVLKGLKEIGIMDKLEVISSVSGGSYANYWYFSQLFYKEKLHELCRGDISSDVCKNQQYQDTQDIFTTQEETDTYLDDPNKYRFQRTLEESSKILAYAHKPSLWNDVESGLQYTAETFFQITSIPFHWLLNGLFDWEININPYFYFYKDGLDRTYGYVPLDYTLEHFANAQPLLIPVFDNIDAAPIFFGNLADFLEKTKKDDKKLPYFVINTTARYGNALNPYGKNPKGEDNQRTLERSVFEFTPWNCYSSLLNSQELSCPQDFHVGFSRRSWGVHELDFSMVVAMSGAAIDGQAQFVDIAGKEENSYSIFGKKFFEIGLDVLNLNLGYQLGNPNIPIEQQIVHKILPWPFYLAHDFLLGNDATSLHFSDGGHSENLGVFALVQRGVKNIIVVDSEYDPQSMFESAKRLKQNLNKYGLIFEFNPSEQCKLSSIKNTSLNCAVLNGNIKQKDNHIISKVIYIKLSAPEKGNAGYDCLPYSVRNYMEKTPTFPHQITADVFFDASQFRAYRGLGYTIVKFNKDMLCT